MQSYWPAGVAAATMSEPKAARSTQSMPKPAGMARAPHTGVAPGISGNAASALQACNATRR
eukprot:11188630-Lingulodinium_polyedra.AAC.1